MRPAARHYDEPVRDPSQQESADRAARQDLLLRARTLSNAAIARRLTVSERTVENHASHILSKLGRSSRAGIASWYATSDS